MQKRMKPNRKLPTSLPFMRGVLRSLVRQFGMAVMTVLVVAQDGIAEEKGVRIAVVDMTRVLAHSTHLSEATERARQKKEESKKVLEERIARYRVLHRKYRSIREALDTDVEGVERDRMLQDADEIMQQAKAIERQIGEYRNRRERKTGDSRVNFRLLVLKDIRTLARDYAKAEGFAFVLDSSAKSDGQGVSDAIIVTKGASVDITEIILRKHNAATRTVPGLSENSALLKTP